MATTYVIVRLLQLVISGILFVLNIISLVQQLQANSSDQTALAYLGIAIIVLFLGAYGSYKHDRSYLITFALILLIAIIVNAVGKSVLYGNLGVSVALIILSLTQAELIKRGYH